MGIFLGGVNFLFSMSAVKFSTMVAVKSGQEARSVTDRYALRDTFTPCIRMENRLGSQW